MTAALYETFREAGYAVAGELDDLAGRARLYHHLYLDSGKRYVFPLIAAHGAMWGIRYFRRGEWGSRLLALRYLFQPALRRARVDAAARFADRFREINRQVCAESYAIYYYTKNWGADDYIRTVIGDVFAEILEECHASNREGTYFSAARREQLFLAFMHWEQDKVVSVRVDEAFDALDWDIIDRLARTPKVALRYLGRGHALAFADFAAKEERIRCGLLAYRRAEEVGLQYVEFSLLSYKEMAMCAPQCAPRISLRNQSSSIFFSYG